MSEEIKSEENTANETEETIENVEHISADITGSTVESSDETEEEGTGKAADVQKKEVIESDMDYDEVYSAIYKDILEHFRSFSPSDEIACKITDEHITEYLEGSREDRNHEYKERREKRLLTALKLIAVLVSIILIVWFLSDSPAILVNILYIIGGLIALWIWKYPHAKDDE